MSTIDRACVRRRAVLGASAALLIAIPASAFAHATLEQASAPSGATYKAVMRIAHGCEGEATHTLSITLPEGFVAAKPMPKPGWTVETVTGPYEKSYEVHGRTVAEGLREVRWTGGSLDDGHYDEFVVNGRLADQAPGTVLAFPTVQTCATGKQEWTERAAPGQDPHDLAKPAPTLTIAASDEAGHGEHASSTASDATTTVGDLVIGEAWTRQTPPGARVGGGYLSVTNNGTEADRLVGGSASFAERVEIHEMAVTDGVMRMRALKSGLEIAPGQTIELKPGGFHVMFMGMKTSPRQGDTVPVRLRFERAGDVEVMMPVAAIGASTPGGTTGAQTGQSHGHATSHEGAKQ